MKQSLEKDLKKGNAKAACKREVHTHVEITIKGNPKEIAALVLEIQERQAVPMHTIEEKSNLVAELLDPQVVEQVSESIVNAIFDATQSN